MPILFYLVAPALYPNGHLPFSLIGDLVIISEGSFIIGGPLYTFLIAAVLLWGRQKTVDEWKTAGWLLPLVFSPLIFLEFLVLVNGDSSVCSALAFGGIGLGLGYIYVLLVSALTFLLQKFGVVENKSN